MKPATYSAAFIMPWDVPSSVRWMLLVGYWTVFPLARVLFFLASGWRRQTFRAPAPVSSWVARNLSDGAWHSFSRPY
jgi:hypothetical protein